MSGFEKSTRVTSSVSLHRELYKQVRELADAEDRTISSMIATLVKLGIRAREESRASKVRVGA